MDQVRHAHTDPDRWTHPFLGKRLLPKHGGGRGKKRGGAGFAERGKRPGLVIWCKYLIKSLLQ